MSEPQKTSGILKELLDSAKKKDPKAPFVQQSDAAMKQGGQGALKALLGASRPATPPAPPQGETVYEAPPMSNPLFPGATKAANSLREKLLARRTDEAAAPASPTAPTPVAGIVPPDAPPPESTPEEVEAANAAKARQEEETEEDAEAAPAASTEPPKKRRGRPPKSSYAAAAPPPAPAPAPVPVPAPASIAAAPAPAVAAPAPALVTEPPPAEPKASEDVPTSTLSDVDELRNFMLKPDASFDCGVEAIFIDCFPSKGWNGEQPADLADVMHAFERVAAQSAKKADYRMIDYQAKGYLAAAIRAMMKALPRAVYLDSRAPGADVFVSVVTPYCKYIFRGSR
jgi:hypothetical protein